MQEWRARASRRPNRRLATGHRRTRLRHSIVHSRAVAGCHVDPEGDRGEVWIVAPGLGACTERRGAARRCSAGRAFSPPIS